MKHMHKQENLSKNQQIVLDYIEKVNEPIKAYSILHNVQKKGIKAPLQVYRALDKLVEIGKIHKIESRNAFVACKNSNCQISKATAFSICESCEEVSEISDSKLSKYLKNFQDKAGMKFNKYNLELRYPISLNPNSTIYGLLFTEAGNSWTNYDNFNPFDLIRAAGLGLGIFMPMFGLLGLDFAHGFDNLSNSNIKSGWQTHFIIGQQF